MRSLLPGLAAGLVVVVGLLAGARPFVRALDRRGTGADYEPRFVIQRLPQLLGGAIVLLDVIALLPSQSVVGPLAHLLGLRGSVPPFVSTPIQWLGVALVATGMGFVVAGWYALGDSFSTDAEILPGHRVRTAGPYRMVMHPVYSGCVQVMLGLSLAVLSPLGTFLTCVGFAPLSLRRARYEEALLLRVFGEEYAAYGKALRWHRLLPRLVPVSGATANPAES